MLKALSGTPKLLKAFSGIPKLAKVLSGTPKCAKSPFWNPELLIYERNQKARSKGGGAFITEEKKNPMTQHAGWRFNSDSIQETITGALSASELFESGKTFK